MLGGKRPPGGRVVVYDCEGYFVAAALAELLAREGREVEFVTGYATVAPFCAETLEGVLLRPRLHELGVAMRTGTVADGHRARAARRATTPTASAFELTAAGVVLVTQRVSLDALYHELDGLPRGASTASATASRRGCSPRRSSTVTASRARSTAPTPRSRCPICASASATATSCRPPPSRLRWLAFRRARSPRGARASSSRTHARRRIASTRCCAPPGADGVVAVGAGAGEAIDAAGAWPSATAPASPSRARRSRPAARREPNSSAHPARRSQPGAYLALGISGALPHLVGMSGSGTVVAVNRDRGARIFEYADLGVVADAGELLDSLLALNS